MTWRDSRRDRPDGRIFRSKCRRRNSWGKSFLKVLKRLGNVRREGYDGGNVKVGRVSGGVSVVIVSGDGGGRNFS